MNIASAQSVSWRWYQRNRSTLHLHAVTLLLTSFICLNGSASPTAGTVVSLGGPSVPADLTNVVAVSAGVGSHCLAIRSDGTVVGWGANLFGEATPPAGLSNAVAVAAGRDFSVVLKSDGTITTWGSSSKVEDMPADLSGVIGIAAGTDHTIVVKADGTVVTWGGINVAPPLGDSDFVAVACAQRANYGLRSDGTVELPGFFPGTTTVISNVVGIAAGGFEDLVMLQSDGTVRQASGFNVSAPGLSNVVAVSSGMALRSDGTVVGLNGTTAPAGLTNVTAIAGRVGNGLVITTWPVITQPPQSQAVNGNTTAIFSVVAAGAPPLSFQWRKNGVDLSGATGTNLTISNVQPTDAGSYDVIVSNNAGSVASAAATLTVNGLPFVLSPPKSETLFVGMRVTFAVSATGSQPLSYQWLKNGASFGGSGGATLSLNNVQLADAGSYSVILSNNFGSVTSAPAVLTIVSNSFVLGPPGTVVGLGSPIVPPGLTDVVAVSAGGGHCLAIRSDGTIVGWGSNLFGEATTPAGLSNVVAVAAGGGFSVVLKSDGTITTWGSNSKIKKMPAGLSGVIGLAASQDHTVIVKADGTAVTWGGINVPLPDGSSNFVAVAAASSFNRGLRSDGTVVVPSFIPPGQFTVISNVVGIAAGGFDTLVTLHSDGTAQLRNGFNVSVPAGLSNVVAVSSGLALRSDGAVFGLSGTAPAGLTNVTAISGGVNNGLVITTNPPAPMLMASSSGTNVTVAAPVSVSGYVLEAADNPTGPFSLIETFTNAPSPLVYPQTDTKKYFRLRKL